MSKSAALLTLGRKLNGNDSFLLSVYDLEPSGITVSAYNQYNSKEYLLPITEMEVHIPIIFHYCIFIHNYHIKACRRGINTPHEKFNKIIGNN